MSAAAIAQWILFGALGLVAVGMAAGMLLTMSMYRAGLALMASFLALAGLFLLLDADLPFAIQVMMNVGGMLVMILFMVMLMMDPGGQDMWAMKRDMRMAGPGALAMHMPFGAPPPASGAAGMSQQAMSQPHTAAASDSTHDAGQGIAEGAGEERSSRMGEMGEMDEMDARAHYQMRVDMAMSTRQLPIALLLGALAATALGLLVLLTPWPVTAAMPSGDASFQVGYLLLSRYMVGFEGAAFLIVGGITGAIVLGRRGDTATVASATSGPAATPPVAEMAQADDGSRQPVTGDASGRAPGPERGGLRGEDA